MIFPLNPKSTSLLLLGSVIASFGSKSLAADDVPDESVAVIRGSNTSTKKDEAVIVMRPESGSFMRETTRLVVEAQAREERAAAERAREMNRQLSEALEAIEQAAEAVRDRPPKQRVILVPLRMGISINPKTRHQTSVRGVSSSSGRDS